MNVEPMRRGWLARVTAVGILVAGSTLPSVCVAASCFKVMDATLYADKPDMPALGIQPIKLVERPSLSMSSEK